MVGTERREAMPVRKKASARERKLERLVLDLWDFIENWPHERLGSVDRFFELRAKFRDLVQGPLPK